MPPSYMVIPQYKLTLDGTALYDGLISAKVIRLENGFDSATIVLNDTSYYPSSVTESSTIQLDVKDASDINYTTILKGVVRFVTPDISPKPKGNSLTLSCLGSGYGLGEMLAGVEYGTESNNPTINTLAEIVSNLTSLYLNKILGGATDSGFSYTNSCTLSNSIPYVFFPYKPVDKCLNDLIDIVSAQNAGSAGIHWIVTTDDVLHVHTIGSTQDEWTKYYGDSQANSTLTYGADYFTINLEKLSPEANYILYYGNWRRPSNGDSWTEATTSGWGSSGITLSVDSANHIVGTKSLRATTTNSSSNTFYYPSSKDAAWNITQWGNGNIQYIPTLNFYVSKHQDVTNFLVKMCTNATKFYSTQQIGYGTTYLENNDEFYHFTLPIGQLWNDANAPTTKIKWMPSIVDGGDWSDINYIEFSYTDSANEYINIDGLHFGQIPLCRVAWNSSLPGGKVKMRLITDNIGKDDTMKSGTLGTTDTGLMAQLAYSELLRLQKTSLVGTVETPMIKNALPGQYFNIQSNDFRSTKIIQSIIPGGAWTTISSITDDVTNSRARPRYEDINKQWQSIRPEFQDRQASSIKAGNIDLTIPLLIEDYAPP